MHTILKFGGRKVATFSGARVPARKNPDGNMAKSPTAVADIVIKCQTRRMIALNRSGRAPVPDGLPPEYLLADVSTSADILHPFFIKLALQRMEPHEGKKAMAVDLQKGGIDYMLMDFCRSVLLGSYVTETYHKHIRSRTLELVRHLLKASQSGGVPGGSCELPVLTVRSFAKACKLRKIGGAIYFFDVRSAYYNGLRALLSSSATSEDDIDAIVTAEQSSEAGADLLLAIHEVMYRPGILDEWAGTSEHRLHFKQIIDESLQGSTFTVRGSGLIARPRKGFKPGDTIADLLFSLTLALILKDIARELSSLGLLYQSAKAPKCFATVQPID